VFISLYLQQLRVVNMMTNTSSNRNKAHLGLGALLLGLAFISWLVLLGGVASVQKLGKQCRNAEHTLFSASYRLLPFASQAVRFDR